MVEFDRWMIPARLVELGSLACVLWYLLLGAPLPIQGYQTLATD